MKKPSVEKKKDEHKPAKLIEEKAIVKMVEEVKSENV
jgi:hypothetical protein